jgi:flagellar basal body-associated protein FliL
MEEQANQSSGGMSKTLIGVVIVIVIVLAAGVYEFT